MVRFVLDDDKVYKVVAESEDAIWVVDYDNPCAPKIVKQDGMKNLKEIPVPDDYIQESVVSRAIYDTARKRLGILSAILSDNAYADQIKESVSDFLIFQAVAEEQKIKVTDDDVNDYFGGDALSVKQAKAYYGEAYLNQNVLYEKVYTWLVDHASIV